MQDLLVKERKSTKRKEVPKEDVLSAAPLMREAYSAIMVSPLGCIRAPYDVRGNIHNFLFLIAVQVQKINAVIAEQCPTICLEI